MNVVTSIMQHMIPQSLEDLIFFLTLERNIASAIDWTVIMAHMKWWTTLRLSMLELKILSSSPRLAFYATADVVIRLQDDPLCVPEEYVMPICLASPSRLLSLIHI